MLLSRHPRLEVLAETNFYPLFQRLRVCYEPLSNPRSLARFVDEVAKVARHIGLVPLSAQDILARVEDPNVPGVFTAWLDAYAGSCGKPRSGEKTPRHCRYLDVIERDLPDSPILFMVRDPRDSAYSGLRSFDRSLASMTADWNEAASALRTHRERVLLVRYEQLVTAPDVALRAICDRLGEAWDPAVLDPARTTPLFLEAHQGHERLREPINAGSVGRFRGLEESQIAWIERECEEGMRLMGYKPVTSSGRQRRAEATPSTSSLRRRTKGLFSRVTWARRLFFWRLRLRSNLWSLQRMA